MFFYNNKCFNCNKPITMFLYYDKPYYPITIGSPISCGTNYIFKQCTMIYLAHNAPDLTNFQ